MDRSLKSLVKNIRPESKYCEGEFLKKKLDSYVERLTLNSTYNAIIFWDSSPCNYVKCSY